MYPGDPNADLSNVYNCRCTVAARVVSIDGVKIGDFDEPPRQTARDLYEKDPKEFDLRQKTLYNKEADKKQLARYRKRLGKDAPRKLSDFQDLKYRDPEKYAELKEYYRYKRRVPEATKGDFEIAKRIK